MNQSELRAPTAERAAFLLDAALAARTADSDEDAKNAHFLFTLHVYQYRVEKVVVEESPPLVRPGQLREDHQVQGRWIWKLSVSVRFGKCHPSTLQWTETRALQRQQVNAAASEAMGSVMCRVAMIAHVSTTPSRYPETLATLQLASRIHRLRRKS
ncbi:kinesin-like protein KIF26A [Caerostris extrusa]|uniref:Kinesin-like protein KIF26A n=1 Tax=Caerostris extrusa TaxID=172846 RepID=A0AAV4SD92_CAEEX|nr:kinesin-like protein KIF26A [Caerostris extrusa]